MWDAHCQHPVKALRRAERGQLACPPTPVMTNPGHPLDAQLIENGKQVRGQLLLLIAGFRRFGPAVAAEIRRDHSETLGQAWDYSTPRPPVLRPAVHQQDRWGVLGTG